MDKGAEHPTIYSAIARQGGLVNTPTTVARTGIRLCDILPDAQFIGSRDILVRSCCGQWDDCQTDDVFVAIVGCEIDGHEFSHEAVKRGASAVVTERLLTIDRPQCIVPDTRKAYGKICQALAGRPSDRMTTVGVSGSDGKTVTSHLIRSVLKEGRKSTGLVSSIEVDLGANRNSVPQQKLNAPSLADQLSQMVMSECSHAVLEISSVSLAQRAMAGVQLDIGVLTNIREDHIDFHGSTENYRRAQLRLMGYLKSHGMMVLNADDPTTHFLLNELSAPALTIGIKQEAHVTAKIIDRHASEQTFIISAGDESIPIRTKIIGDQHVYNCLAATAVGLAFGMELSAIASGLERVQDLPGRMERIECGQPFTVMVDSARSPNQLATALSSLRKVTKGNLWCVVSTDEEQNSKERRRLGEVAEKSADQVILTQTSVEQVVDYEPAHQVMDGVDDPASIRLIPNRFRAIEWALQQAQPGDTVLVTGCGEKPFALVGEEKWTINDRDVCQAWLYDNASMSELDSTVNGLEPEIFKIDDYR